jgi:glucan 1,3-beta-glucosidase
VVPLPRGHALSLPVVRFAALAGMAIATLGLLFNARYRDFPVSMFLIYAVGFALLRLPPPPREQKAVALLLAAAALGMLINEGWLNTHAWLWAATAGVLAAATLIRPRGVRG